jgi:hypothetical protein
LGPRNYFGHSCPVLDDCRSTGSAWGVGPLVAVPDGRKPRWAASVLIIETVQLISAAAAISAVVARGWAWVLALGSGTSSATLARKISRIQGFENFVNEMGRPLIA